MSLLRAASDRHTDGNRLAMAGMGVDRHLFALYVISKGRQMESAFLQYAIAQPWTLSTSQVLL